MDDITTIDYKGVRGLVGYSRTQLKRKMDAGTFPMSFKLGDEPKSRLVWWRREVADWLKARSKK